jgi:hypothetical protein
LSNPFLIRQTRNGRYLKRLCEIHDWCRRHRLWLFGPNLASSFAAREVTRIVVIAKANPAQHGATAHAHPSPRITMDALDLRRRRRTRCHRHPIASQFTLAQAAEVAVPPLLQEIA